MKLMVRVRPGVELTCAIFCPSRELIRLDLPTFDRPRKANSGGPSGGKNLGSAAEVRNLADIGFMLQNRLFGFAAGAFDLTDKNGVPIDPHFIPLEQLAPGKFLSSPSLWLGLIVAAIFFVAAVRMRRYREPL